MMAFWIFFASSIPAAISMGSFSPIAFQARLHPNRVLICFALPILIKN